MSDLTLDQQIATAAIKNSPELATKLCAILKPLNQDPNAFSEHLLSDLKQAVITLPKRTASTPGTKYNSSLQDSEANDYALIESLPTISTKALMEFLQVCMQDATPLLEHLMKHVEAELRFRSSQDEPMAESSDVACQQVDDGVSSKRLQTEIAAIMATPYGSSTKPLETPTIPPRVLTGIPKDVGENFCLYTIVMRCAENSDHGLSEDALAGCLAISSLRTRFYLKHLSRLGVISETQNAGTKTYRIHSSVKDEWISSLVPTFECTTLDQLKSRYLNTDKPRVYSVILRALRDRLDTGDDWVAARDLIRTCSITSKQLSCRCTQLIHQGLIEGSGLHEEIRKYRLSEKMKTWLKDRPDLLEM